ncbi:Hypothetical protein FKW44_013869 [Caligus rogercresseyi]|uniref:Uncharacterized protein n=1 Tax=Caligus rogercresseyi TaxID=217165 RepID=A0A7T8K011_CALRO|nr:Hypothetical protein FKW44_013869 [Caligus rogercresseyi]
MQDMQCNDESLFSPLQLRFERNPHHTASEGYLKQNPLVVLKDTSRKKYNAIQIRIEPKESHNADTAFTKYAII